MSKYGSLINQVGKAVLKISGGLILLYIIVIAISYSLFALGESKKYTHCDTFNSTFIKTAEARNISPNSSRLSDLQILRVMLEIHIENNGRYPMVTEGSSVERWDNLLAELDLQDDKKKLSDPCNERNPDYQYSYSSSDDGLDYVLKAILSEDGTYKSKLLNDVYGLWCGELGTDREYCIGPPRE